MSELVLPFVLTFIVVIGVYVVRVWGELPSASNN